VYRTLVAHDLERTPDVGAPVHRFLTTGDPTPFGQLASRFLGPEVSLVEAI
jgi:glutamate racemase